MTLGLVVNGAERKLVGVAAGASVRAVVEALGMKVDRVAVEQNGEIVRRAAWEETAVMEGDRLEIVHFVGGGIPA